MCISYHDILPIMHYFNSYFDLPRVMACHINLIISLLHFFAFAVQLLITDKILFLDKTLFSDNISKL